MTEEAPEKPLEEQYLDRVRLHRKAALELQKRVKTPAEIQATGVVKYCTNLSDCVRCLAAVWPPEISVVDVSYANIMERGLRARQVL
jgi:hypothetical protein